MSNLTSLRARVRQLLADSGASNFPDELVDESLQRALDEYSQFNPQQGEALLILPGDGWEIALDSVSGLLSVLDVYWRYDSTLAEDEQEANRVARWFLWWDDAQPVVTLTTVDNSMPQLNDEVRLWYTARHTIDGLGEGTLTSVPGMHESLLVIGAAGFAAMSKSAELMLTADADMYAATLMATWGRAKEREFRKLLSQLAVRIGVSGPAQAANRARQGWKMDKWDRGY